LAVDKLAVQVKPVLHKSIPESTQLADATLELMLEKLRSDMKTVNDAPDVLRFYFVEPRVTKNEIIAQIGEEKTETVLQLITQCLKYADKTDLFLTTIKKEGKEKGLKIKEIFGTVRYVLTGKFQGPSMHDIFEILEDEKIKKRLGNI